MEPLTLSDETLARAEAAHRAKRDHAAERSSQRRRQLLADARDGWILDRAAGQFLEATGGIPDGVRVEGMPEPQAPATMEVIVHA